MCAKSGVMLRARGLVFACLIGAVASPHAVAGQASKGAGTSKRAPTSRACKVEGQQVTRQGKVYQCVRGSDGQMAYVEMKDIIISSAVGSTGGSGVAEGQACTSPGKRVTMQGKAYQCVHGLFDDSTQLDVEMRTPSQKQAGSSTEGRTGKGSKAGPVQD